jgi:WD40 repeat protein
LFLWDLADGTELLGGNPGINTMAVAFSPDGRYLAYVEITSNGYPVILRSLDGSEIYSLWEGHETPVWEIFFSPDGSLLVTAGGDILIWQVDGGKLLYMSKGACP